MTEAHPEKALSAVQREALRVFGGLRDSEEFYLSGAAALSGFYLGHRRSQDLDLFTSADPLIDPVGRDLERALAEAGLACEVIRRFRTFAEFVAERGGQSTRIQLAQDSPFRLEPTRLTYHEVRIDSFRDLAANKLLAAFGRAAPRDLVDVYVLATGGRCSFDDLVRWGREKDPGLDAYALARSLRTVEELPDDAEALPVDMLVPLDVAEMRRVLLAEARRLLDRGLPP